MASHIYKNSTKVYIIPALGKVTGAPQWVSKAPDHRAHLEIHFNGRVDVKLRQYLEGRAPGHSMCSKGMLRTFTAMFDTRRYHQVRRFIFIVHFEMFKFIDFL